MTASTEQNTASATPLTRVQLLFLPIKNYWDQLDLNSLQHLQDQSNSSPKAWDGTLPWCNDSNNSPIKQTDGALCVEESHCGCNKLKQAEKRR